MAPSRLAGATGAGSYPGPPWPGLGFGLLPTGIVRGGPLLALGGDHAVGDQLADRKREVLGGGPELLVDLLDAQARVALHERCEALGQRLEIRRGALCAAASSRTTDATEARGSDRGCSRGSAAPAAPERRFQRVDGRATCELGDLCNESLHDTIHLSLEITHSRPRSRVKIVDQGSRRHSSIEVLDVQRWYANSSVIPHPFCHAML